MNLIVQLPNISLLLVKLKCYDSSINSMSNIVKFIIEDCVNDAIDRIETNTIYQKRQLVGNKFNEWINSNFIINTVGNVFIYEREAMIDIYEDLVLQYIHILQSLNIPLVCDYSLKIFVFPYRPSYVNGNIVLINLRY